MTAARGILLALLLAGCNGGPAIGPRPSSSSAPSASNLAALPLGQPPGEATLAAAAINNPLEGSPQAVAQGKALFTAMNCVYCHGPQGSGLIGPPLDSAAWRYGGAPAQIYNSIHDGRPQGMPAWGSRLPPEQIWQLVAYLESFGGAAPPANMTGVGPPEPSTTGPQVAGQVQTDTAHQGLEDANKRPGRP
ncbi:MAG TPA: c-type cytochrome [Caulobacteraceae bacterium]|nr:c-type cytochrome [Caulobacteraceae bacterium]